MSYGLSIFDYMIRVKAIIVRYGRGKWLETRIQYTKGGGTGRDIKGLGAGVRQIEREQRSHLSKGS